MKITLTIDDGLVRQLDGEASRQGRTRSQLVEAALRRMLEMPFHPQGELPELPSFAGGKPRVDVADREALYRVMEASD